MRRTGVELAVVTAVAATLVLSWLGGGGLWDPAEAPLVERLWTGDVGATRPLDALATTAGLAIAGPTPTGARLGHAVFGLAAVLAVWLVAPGSRRARLFAVAALLASPAFLLAARSAAGGIVAVMPIALSAWGFIDHLRSGRRSSLGVGVVGAWLATLATGIAACAVPLVAVLALWATTPALRRHAVVSVIAIAAAGALAIMLARVLDAPLVPGGLPPTLAFADGLGRIGLGLFPLVLALPIAFVVAPLDDDRRCWLAFSAAWSLPVMLWPQDPWIALAQSGVLAIVAGDAFDAFAGSDDSAPALAIVVPLGALIIARSFHLEPAQLVGAHVAGDVATAAKLGALAWLAFAVLAAALAWAMVGRRRALAIRIALAASLVVACRGAYLGTRTSASLDELVALADKHALPLEAGLGTNTHAVRFAHASIRDLRSVEALAQYLAAPGCRAAVVAEAELVALQRRARGRFFILGEPRADMVLATSCLPPGTTDANWLATGLLATPPTIGRVVDAEWGGAIRLRAVDVEVQISTRAEELPVTLVFDIIKQPPPKYAVTLRMSGCDSTFIGDHRLLEGKLASDALRPSDIVVDRAKIALDKPKTCAYTLSVGWRAGRTLLPARDGVDESERVPIGTVTVVPAR